MKELFSSLSTGFDLDDSILLETIMSTEAI